MASVEDLVVEVEQEEEEQDQEQEQEQEQEQAQVEDEAPPTDGTPLTDKTPPLRAYSCPMCGMLFSESTVCGRHARFCTATEDEPSVEWTDERILLLMDCMQARYKKYLDLPPRQRQDHWKSIGRIVGTSGEETRYRWNHLAGSYTRVRALVEQGRTRGKVWRFYNKMDKILGDGAKARPEFVLSATPLKANADGVVHLPADTPEEGEGELVSTAKLVELMEEKYSEFCNTLAKDRKKFWTEFGEKLNITAEEARGRWNMLVGSFKRTKHNLAQQASRYGRGPRHKWRYYDQMERIVGRRFNNATQLTVLSAPQLQSAAGAVTTILTTNNPQLNIAPAPAPSADGTAAPAGAAAPAAGQSVAGVYKLGPNGLMEGVPPATVSNVQATVLQAGTPQQQQAEIEAFATKRKALFVEDYLRAKARREELRLQLEERRIKALERLVDVMEARGNS